MRRFSFFVFLAALAAVLGNAQSSSITIQAAKTPADSGEQMYASYCASCHGMDGRGQGKLAASLNARPTDLTLLSRTHGGEFPESHLVTILRNGMESDAPSSKLMPTWGPVLYKLDSSRGSATLQSLRIANLIGYIKTLQQ
jgi:hypothetical protein